MRRGCDERREERSESQDETNGAWPGASPENGRGQRTRRHRRRGASIDLILGGVPVPDATKLGGGKASGYTPGVVKDHDRTCSSLVHVYTALHTHHNDPRVILVGRGEKEL